MARFTLIVLPTGKVIVTSPEHLDTKELEAIQQQWDRAQRDDTALVILPDCDVVRAGKP